MKKVVISGYYGFNNFGDESILKILVDALRGEDIDITVLSSNPELTSQLNKVNSFQTFNLADVIHQIFVCDILISGGGSIFQDKTSNLSFFYYLMVLFIGILFKKKVVVFAQGFEPLSNKYLEKIFRKVLQKVDYISVRDNKSFDYLARLGVRSRQFADVAWSLPKVKVDAEDKIVVQLRSFAGMGDEQLNILAKAIVNKFENKQVEILSLQDDIDLDICKTFADKLRLLDMDVDVFSDLNQQEVINKISSAKYVIAMRYHACLVAIKQGVATFAISYDDKVKNLAREFKFPYVELGSFYRGLVKKGLDDIVEQEFDNGLIFEKQKQAKQAVDDIINLVENIEVFD